VKRRKILLAQKTAKLSKLGRFSQQSWLFGSSSGPTAHPGPPGALRDGADLESSVTGAEAEALAYYQGVPPGRSGVWTFFAAEPNVKAEVDVRIAAQRLNRLAQVHL
jgi:hypothetical protein